jgi:hypothetical protein
MQRRALGLTRSPPAPIDLVRGMSWLMSLAGLTPEEEVARARRSIGA